MSYKIKPQISQVIAQMITASLLFNTKSHKVFSQRIAKNDNLTLRCLTKTLLFFVKTLVFSVFKINSELSAYASV